MSEERVIYSLSQLGESLRRTLEQATQGRALWFRAEISQVKGSGAGHVYLDLVEEEQGAQVAAMKATIWRDQHQRILQELGDAASDILQKGSEIVFSARIRYHAVFGVSLSVEEIDFSAMLGEAERRKQATLKILQTEGAFGKNSAIPLPRLVSHIALIGSPGTSGFRDFAFHLLHNEWHYRFELDVFAAIVQGKEAPAAMAAAIEAAHAVAPDAIVLVRGGGSALDLDAFNDLGLCQTIAQARVPILTGVGHETDLSLADLVAHRQFKTPTAVADFLVDRTGQEASLISEWMGQIGLRARGRMALEQQRLAAHHQVLRMHPARVLSEASHTLTHLRQRVADISQRNLERHLQRMSEFRSTVQALRPENTLKRGFAILRKDGRAVTDANHLVVDDLVALELQTGHVEARVIDIKPRDNTTP
ncbi:MAG: exodeoxyribonuclease VII large subunit [Bacteroidetes bacterium]|nr:exodeoxyribonuclease VII large subunit [Bacteroidota bacterium]MDA0904514.1 exodeoxyribonuclease VII large subunit [Bacteroidota bacterium]MDA1242258.1 exodeoxyribonuclease VII large subunit [Bacteroidota bacterium]